MTLIGAILKNARSQESLHSTKIKSPPPETLTLPKKNKTKLQKYQHIKSKVDTSPPWYSPVLLYHKTPGYAADLDRICIENAQLLWRIRQAHFNRGKVDCRWVVEPKRLTQYEYTRLDFYRRTEYKNLDIHRLLKTTKPRVQTTASLHADWVHNKREMLMKAHLPFVLFSVDPAQDIEDKAFVKPDNVDRPIVKLRLFATGGCALGVVQVELFSDVCPASCRLFTDLCQGDEAGYGYVGTRVFRKVPGLFWSGGDVVFNNGFGCYAQKGRYYPIGAENYHFSHSMPGLLSMRVTSDDEVCGIFNITFKPLPQLDLKNVVFGRVIRPCATFDRMKEVGNAINSRPEIVISDVRLQLAGKWTHGTLNTKLVDTEPKRFVASRT